MAELMNYSNQNVKSTAQIEFGSVTRQDRTVLHNLAARFSEAAHAEKTLVRKRQWRALHDLKPERPMILFEPLSVSGYVTDKDILCENQLLRNVERSMRYSLKQYNELDDDMVIEPYFRLAWRVLKSSYGVDIVEHHTDNSMGYMSNFPIQTPEDLDLLKERTFRVDRETTNWLKDTMMEIFGDVLPVRVGNCDNFFAEPGFNPFCGNNHIGGTMDLFKLTGYENMMLWVYDNPEALHRLMRYLTDDKISFYNFLKAEGLMDANTDNQFVGPSSYGYVSSLAQMDTQAPVDFADVWCWAESQETQPIGPDMFDEVFLPYIAEVANMFGLSYYGCCERVDDRIDRVKKAMPNLRTVSVSGWSNMEHAAELLTNRFVYSRKPAPTNLSGSSMNWELAEKDIRDTHAATKKYGCTEYIVRDVYDVDNDFGRIRQWVDMTKRIIGR